jgi:isopenicillin N synthase-like dioxygenase
VTNAILDVDLLAFEQGDETTRRAVVDGVRRSLQTGFVYTSHDLSEDLLDEAYGMLAEFFSKPIEEKQRFVAPGSHGQTGYTGLLVETAATSDVPDWKEMLNWGREAPEGIRCAPAARTARAPGPARAAVPGITKVLNEFTTASPSCSSGSSTSSPSPSAATRRSSTRCSTTGRT